LGSQSSQGTVVFGVGSIDEWGNETSEDRMTEFNLSIEQLDGQGGSEAKPHLGPVDLGFLDGDEGDSEE
jgi:hypothetical protein